MVALLSVGETRRVKSVSVLKNGEYVPLDVNEVYTVTATNYMIKNGGCGMGVYLADNEIIANEFVPDYQAVLDYFDYLGGNFSAYEKTEGRVIID